MRGELTARVGTVQQVSAQVKYKDGARSAYRQTRPLDMMNGC